MILHIPHAKNDIPEVYRDYFTLSDADLNKELLLLVDLYTDELFHGFQSVVFQYPRLLVDVERFQRDEDEPMSNVGMGMIYQRTVNGQRLKRELSVEEVNGLRALYIEHHQALTDAVGCELVSKDIVMLVDCHSFPSEPLSCDLSQKTPRPDFCIGTDAFHTPARLVDSLCQHIQKLGYSVHENEPYQGVLVPVDFYHTNANVAAVMIEVNRALYMDERTGAKLKSFARVQSHIKELLICIQQYGDKMIADKKLIQAYENAKYMVNDSIELRVGKDSVEIDEWLSQKGVDLAAFITPENPYSQPLTLAQNAKRHTSFITELDRSGIDFVEGYGVDDEDTWPRENSYLVLVEDKLQADQLARSYGQNAYLLCQKGSPVELVLCES
jgi:N-formylglutamate amidohydrolase